MARKPHFKQTQAASDKVVDILTSQADLASANLNQPPTNSGDITVIDGIVYIDKKVDGVDTWTVLDNVGEPFTTAERLLEIPTQTELDAHQLRLDTDENRLYVPTGLAPGAYVPEGNHQPLDQALDTITVASQGLADTTVVKQGQSIIIGLAGGFQGRWTNISGTDQLATAANLSNSNLFLADTASSVEAYDTLALVPDPATVTSGTLADVTNDPTIGLRGRYLSIGPVGFPANGWINISGGVSGDAVNTPAPSTEVWENWGAASGTIPVGTKKILAAELITLPDSANTVPAPVHGQEILITVGDGTTWVDSSTAGLAFQTQGAGPTGLPSPASLAGSHNEIMTLIYINDAAQDSWIAQF